MDELPGLWRRYRADGDEKAYARIVLHHAPLARFVAGRMRSPLPRTVEERDMIESGLRGLLAAVKSFDPDGGTAFEEHAVPMIKDAIIEGLRAKGQLPESEIMRARVALDPMWDFGREAPGGGAEAVD